MKVKTPGLCLTGSLIMMEMPSDMKGLVKSATCSRWELMVRGAMAISASLLTSSPTIPVEMTLITLSFSLSQLTVPPPGIAGVRRAVLPVLHWLDQELDPGQLGDGVRQVLAVTLVPVIAVQNLPGLGLPEHHVGLLQYGGHDVGLSPGKSIRVRVWPGDPRSR